MKTTTNKISFNLNSFETATQKRIRSMEVQHINERLWDRDATLWKDDEESTTIISQHLDWLDAPSKMVSALPQILQFVKDIQAAGFTHLIVIGMGGSSLSAIVLERIFKAGENGLTPFMLDTTDPATIQAIEQKVPLEKTLLIIASKSGMTTETNVLGDYFYNKIKAVKGKKAGSHFVAITDPGTPLVEKARSLQYRHIFLNFLGISPPYSSISYVGMVPAALMGLDVETLLERALQMQQSCQAQNIPLKNTALKLGAIIGEMAIQHRNKLTFVLPDSLSAFGMWLEQLIAVSTGKEGKGILPITGESLLDPSFYQDDRLFVYLHLQEKSQPEITQKLNSLTAAGHPVITIEIEDKLDLAGEFYRWQIAVAVACAIIHINPFDQPNVRESNQRTSQILSKFAKKGMLPTMHPVITEDKLTFFTYRNKFKNAVDLLDTFLGGEHVGDYLAIQAFLPEDPHTDHLLQKFRTILQQRLQRATTVAYGPRFLHSAGQYHKGGPNTGLFIQLTVDDKDEINIPGKKYSFGTYKRAQADGDFSIMLGHSRRIIRVDLNGGIHQGMTKLIKLVGPQ